jgi:hypothetical protein
MGAIALSHSHPKLTHSPATDRREDLLEAWNTGLLEQLFLDHPRSLGESYWQHQRRALRFGVSMIGGGAACLVHALLPAVFVHTASSTVQRLYEEMRAAGRLRRSPAARPSPPAAGLAATGPAARG